MLGLLAAFVFAASGPSNGSAWALIAAMLCLAIAGFKAQTLIRDQYETIRQRQSQIELLQSEIEQQRHTVDALADGLDVGIFMCDAKANILYANQRAGEMFSFTDIVGRSILAISLSYDLEQLVVTALGNQLAQAAELTFSYPKEHIAKVRAWPVDEKADRAFVAINDISDLRRLERIRRDFVANVSHELRTPLAIIRTMAETLAEDPESRKTKLDDYLAKIVTEVDRLSAITQDLLSLSTAESTAVHKGPCDIAHVFRDAVDQLRPKAKEKNLQLDYEGPNTCVIAASTEQMRQVALNLVDNAIIYTLQGTIRVEVTPGDVAVEIRVSDTGIGVAKEHQPRIFERFYRVDKARSRSTGGTGLGLSIVKHIVEAHGGTVEVDSSLNKGSVFTITLPVGPVGVSPAAS